MRTNTILFETIAVGLISGIIFAGCGNKEKEKTETPVESSSAHKVVGENGVAINEEAQNRIGLVTEMLVATNFIPSAKGYGRVLDPTPLNALAAELASAQIAATGSWQELERVKILKENASEKSLQLAQANFTRDQLAVETAQTKLQSTWGKEIAAQEKLPEFQKPLVTGNKILVRITLPAGEALSATPTEITLTSLASAKPLKAKFLELLPQMDEQMQGQGFLFIADGRNDFPPGAAVSGLMQTFGDAQIGAIVPRTAILRHEGKTWVYLKTATDHFVRHEVNLKIPTDAGWFVSNFATTNAVVIRGAQILLSEENKAQMGAGE